MSDKTLELEIEQISPDSSSRVRSEYNRVVFIGSKKTGKISLIAGLLGIPEKELKYDKYKKYQLIYSKNKTVKISTDDYVNSSMTEVSTTGRVGRLLSSSSAQEYTKQTSLKYQRMKSDKSNFPSELLSQSKATFVHSRDTDSAPSETNRKKRRGRMGRLFSSNSNTRSRLSILSKSTARSGTLEREKNIGRRDSIVKRVFRISSKTKKRSVAEPRKKSSVHRPPLGALNEKHEKRLTKAEKSYLKDIELGFSVWEFETKEVLYPQHHFFLPANAVYVIYFDAQKLILDDHSSVQLLMLWLNSIKLHASHASIFLVSTNLADNNNKVDEKLRDLFHQRYYKYEKSEKGNFFPIDFSTKAGIFILCQSIKSALYNNKYIEVYIPSSFVTMQKKFTESEKNYITYDEARMLIPDIVEDEFKIGLRYLNSCGVITYFHSSSKLMNVVVLNSEWFFIALSKFFFDSPPYPSYSDSFSEEFGIFNKQRTLSPNLFDEFLMKMKGSIDDNGLAFFKTLLLEFNLMCEYPWRQTGEQEIYFAIPKFYLDKNTTSRIYLEDFDGPTIRLDFSGDYRRSNKIEKYFLRRMPAHFFHKLICAVIQESEESRKSSPPVLDIDSYTIINIMNLKLLFSLVISEIGEPVAVQISFETDVEHQDVFDIVRIIYLQAQTLCTSFVFREQLTKTRELCFKMVLLVSSTTGKSELFADYDYIHEAILTGRADKQFYLTPHVKQKVAPRSCPNDFISWWTPDFKLTDPD